VDEKFHVTIPFITVVRDVKAGGGFQYSVDLSAAMGGTIADRDVVGGAAKLWFLEEGMLEIMSDRGYRPVPLQFERLPEEVMAARGRALLDRLVRRRSVREFAPDAVPKELIETAIATANTAPSGANRQPWHFVAVSDPEVKAEIRKAAEAEEREFYEGGRASEAWLEALAPLGTGWQKPFLETAPWLVVVFKQIFARAENGAKGTNYYVNESVGIACGLLIAAINEMGLATLTHTPQPMRFLSRILGRPDNERPYILFPVGYPHPDCRVPSITKKDLGDVSSWFEE
jgi:iodotyrosine deiodinase